MRRSAQLRKGMEAVSVSKFPLHLAAFAAIVPTVSFGASDYQLTPLGTLGEVQSFAYAINNSGQIVGESDTADGYRRAFLYSNGTMSDLGTLGGQYSSAYGINDAGQVVGQADAANGGQHAFLFANGSMTVVGPTNTYSLAYAINASGSGRLQEYMHAPDNVHAALFDHGTTVDLDQNSGRSWGWGLAINSSGQIGGIGGVGDGPIRAAIFNQGAITYPTDVVPYTTWITAINNQGIAAGQSMGHAALFDGEGNVTDLDTLAGVPNFPYVSEAFGINNQGEVVGISNTLNQGDHAFLYKDGTMLDLNALVDPNLGWTLTEATAINDVGQIAGYGNFNGQIEAFLLTPAVDASPNAVPEPAAVGVFGLGSLMLLLWRHRGRGAAK